MEFHEAVNRLEGLRRLRPKLGTETTASTLAFLDVRPEELPAVQIAGSNGKGSTARILEQILAETGLEVGLYTSPDLNGLRERIRVGGRPIPKRAVTRFVEAIEPHVLERSVANDAPTYFEALTAMAVWYFDREDVDVAVLEVGIGGRYDATSVVDPAAAAVTSVSLEHTDIIGSTVEEIAADKASVAPDGRPLVTGATGAALETIRTQTDIVTVGADGAVGCEDDGDGDRGVVGDGSGTGVHDGRLVRTAGEQGGREDDVDVRASEVGMASRTESTVVIEGADWSVETTSPLLGPHQAVNAAIAATLARQVASPGVADVAAGIRNVHWPGRFEVMGTDPLVVLDGAHNPAACETLAGLVGRFDVDSLSLVFGAMCDKDHGEMCRALPDADRVLVAEPGVGRAQDATTLAAIFERETGADVCQYPTVHHALERAIEESGPSDAVLVTGSLYVVGEARDRWTRTPREVRADSHARSDAALGRANVPASRRAAIVDRMGRRTVRLHARRPVAEELRTRMLTAGGTAGVSGIDVTDSHVEVVLSGTTEEFVGLAGELDGAGGEIGHVAAQLRDVLALGDVNARREVHTFGDVHALDDRGRGPETSWVSDTAVMGVLNVTPDSFHDGGEYEAVEAAIERAREMVAGGADLVDVGGESTRPGAEPVPADVERDRVLPVIEGLSDLEATLSIDTRKPDVAAAAIDAGADVVNDVTGLADARMRRLVADRDVTAVVTHSITAPVDPERTYEPDDIVDAVLSDLTERVLLAERAGIDRSNLIVDPGLGFGKTARDSFRLLDRLDELHALRAPVMVGHSHKSMVSSAGDDPNDRFVPTVAATALAAERGADVVRVHDVAANVAAIDTADLTSGED